MREGNTLNASSFLQDEEKYIPLLEKLEGLMPVTIKIIKDTSVSFVQMHVYVLRVVQSHMQRNRLGKYLVS